MGLLAELFVNITGRKGQLDSTLAGVKTQLAGVAAFSNRIGAGLLAGLGVASGVGGALAIGAALGKAVMGASDLNESLSKVDAVFGPGAAAVKKQADEMAEKFGSVKHEILDANARLAGLGKGIGNLSGSKLTGFTTQFTKLAADMSSFQNISFEEAITALSSGLSGEIEPLKRFGVVLSDDAVKAKALAMGLASSKAEISDQAKFAARLQIILEKTADAQGDLEKTLEGFANQARKLAGGLVNALTKVGQILAPLTGRLVKFLNTIASSIGGFVERNGPAFTSFAERVGAAFDYVYWAGGQVAEAVAGLGSRLAGEVGSWGAYRAAATGLGAAWEWLRATASAVFEGIGVVFRNWSLIMGIAGIKAYEFAINAGEAFTWLGDAAGQFLAWFGANWTRLFADAFNATLAIARNFSATIVDNLKAVWDWLASGGTGELKLAWTPLLDGFKATMDKLPEIARPAFTSLQGDIDRLKDEMLKVETARRDRLDAARVKGPEAGPEGGPKAAGGPAGEAAAKEQKGGFSGFEEFSKKLQEGIAGGSAASKTAEGVGALVKLTERGNQLREQILKKPAGPGFVP